MSLYQVGCLVPTRGHALEKQAYSAGLTHVGGALIATPGYISDLIHAMDMDVVVMDREIARNAGIPGFGGGAPDEAKQQWWRTTWLPFMKAWTDFRDDHSHWYNNMWGAVVDTVAKFRQQLIDLRSSAAHQGFEFQGPAPQAPDLGWVNDLGNSLKGVGTFLKNVVYALLVIGGMIVVYKFVLLRRS